MAYVAPNTFTTKNQRIDLKPSKTPSRCSQIIRQKLHQSTLSSLNDSQGSKTFAEVVILEKKKIHQRDSIQKTRTLPSIKKNNVETRQTSTIARQEGPCKNTSVIRLNEKKSDSQKNTKTGILKPLDKSNIQLKIQIKKHRERRTRKKISVDFTSFDESSNPTIMMTSTTSSMSNMAALNNLVSIGLSPVTSDRMNLSEDPFYFMNILKNYNFTSFHAILEGSLELSVNSFPYYIRIFRKFYSAQPAFKTFNEKAPKALHECSCLGFSQVLRPLKSLRIRKVQRFIPSLRTLYFSPQGCRFLKNLVVLNFENVFGENLDDLALKPLTLTVVRKLCKSFQVVLVCQKDYEMFLEILMAFSDLGIKLSAGYQMVFPENCFREGRKMLDYSRIYQDFSIVSPEKQVLVITSHRLAENSQDVTESLIVTKTGLTVKLNVDRSPVPYDDYQFTPLTVLLNSSLVKENPSTLKKISRQVSNIQKINAGFDSLHFKFLIPHQVTKILTSSIHKLLYEKIQGLLKPPPSKPELFCKHHRKFSFTTKEKFLENMFLI